MKDKYAVVDLGLDESQDYLISPEFPNAQEAIRRLKTTFIEQRRAPSPPLVQRRRSGGTLVETGRQRSIPPGDHEGLRSAGVLRACACPDGNSILG
jgi:hypothetical protein